MSLREPGEQPDDERSFTPAARAYLAAFDHWLRHPSVAAFELRAATLEALLSEQPRRPRGELVRHCPFILAVSLGTGRSGLYESACTCVAGSIKHRGCEHAARSAAAAPRRRGF